MIEIELQDIITVVIRAQDDALLSLIPLLHMLFVTTLGIGHLSMVAKIMRVPFAKQMKIVEIVKVGMHPLVPVVTLDKPIRKSFQKEICQDAMLPDGPFLQPRPPLLQLRPRLWLPPPK